MSKTNFYQNKLCCLFFVFLLIFTGVQQVLSRDIEQSHNQQVSFLEYTVDCDITNGIIDTFGHINCGPLPNWDETKRVDLTSQYQQIGITHIRTHDFFGPTDISWIFPNWSADPSNPASYNFSISDDYITGIINAGCQVFYRLGESASADENLRRPPENFTKWSEVCRHIVMHYNEGWNNGFYYKITHWEIWNEPDLSGFWNGTAPLYYELYHNVADHLKNHNQSLKIGGPCTSSLSNENFTSQFLNYVKEHQVPLDFYSWHRYADSPHQLYTDARFVRELLDSYGFTETENINTEWNINLLYPQRDNDNAKNAAFTAGSLSVFQDASMDYAFRYRGTQDDNALMKLIGFDIALFTIDGLFKTPTLSYLAYQTLFKDTPVRVQLPEMDGADGITLLAGVSEDKNNISLLFSNYGAPATDILLDIQHIADASYSLTSYLIDDDTHFEITKHVDSYNMSPITLHLEKNTVQFLRLTTSSSLPAEGPEVAPIPFILKLPFFDPLFQILGILIMLLIFG